MLYKCLLLLYRFRCKPLTQTHTWEVVFLGSGLYTRLTPSNKWNTDWCPNKRKLNALKQVHRRTVQSLHNTWLQHHTESSVLLLLRASAHSASVRHEKRLTPVAVSGSALLHLQLSRPHPRNVNTDLWGRSIAHTSDVCVLLQPSLHSRGVLSPRCGRSPSAGHEPEPPLTCRCSSPCWSLWHGCCLCYVTTSHLKCVFLSMANHKVNLFQFHLKLYKLLLLTHNNRKKKSI